MICNYLWLSYMEGGMMKSARIDIFNHTRWRLPEIENEIRGFAEEMPYTAAALKFDLTVLHYNRPA